MHKLSLTATLALTLAVAALTAMPAHAVNYYLQGNMPNGSWWEQTPFWFDQPSGGGNNPTAFDGNDDLFTQGYTLRSGGSGRELNVGSLTVTGQINVQSTNSTSSVAHLIVKDGTRFEQNRANSGFTVDLLTMDGNTEYHADSTDGLHMIATTIEGAGNFEITGGAYQEAGFNFGNASAYTGDIILKNDDVTLRFLNGLSTHGGLIVEGTDPNIALDQDVTFVYATINGDVLNPGTYSFATLNGSYDEIFDDGGTGSITVVPEPASVAMLAMGGALMLRRRK